MRKIKSEIPVLFQFTKARLKELRHKKGLTQEQVSDDTRTNIGLYETGAVNITSRVLAVLCDYYGVSLKEFFDGVPFPASTPLTDDEIEMPPQQNCGDPSE